MQIWVIAYSEVQGRQPGWLGGPYPLGASSRGAGPQTHIYLFYFSYYTVFLIKSKKSNKCIYNSYRIMTSITLGIKSQVKCTWQWQQFARLLTKSVWVAEIDYTVLRFMRSTDTFSLCQPVLIIGTIWDLCLKEAEVESPQCISTKLKYRCSP